MARIFSGIQPTGSLHLGNYLGAIKQWVAMQHDVESIFCVVDMHAITVPQNPKALHDAVLETAAVFIASGIDPEKSIMFQQSTVPQHAELAWVLNCHTPLGWLNRMTQFKEKAGKKKDMASLGLYGYPALMAADILLYRTTHVPVGEDQKQHLELTRDIAGAFNRFVDQEFFVLPEPVIKGAATRVMSLRDGTKKMSKSDASDMARINLTDDAELIAKKIKKAKSDMLDGVTFDEAARPEASNLLNIYAALSGEVRADVEARYENSDFASFKQDLAALAADTLGPVTQEIQHLLKDKGQLMQWLNDGTERAQEIAATTMNDVRKLIGYAS